MWAVGHRETLGDEEDREVPQAHTLSLNGGSVLALFVSKYREYELVLWPTRAVPNQFTGERVVHQKGEVAKFLWAGRGLEPWALDQAVEQFQFTGLGHNEDPLKRLSFYDTDAQAALQGWDDEYHEKVIDTLRKKQNDAYMEAVRPKIAPPWPNYDKVQNAKAVANMVSELGVEIGHALMYERENANRPEVIEALEALTAEPEVEAEVEVTA